MLNNNGGNIYANATGNDVSAPTTSESGASEYAVVNKRKTNQDNNRTSAPPPSHTVAPGDGALYAVVNKHQSGAPPTPPTKSGKTAKPDKPEKPGKPEKPEKTR
jgi:hypothetical protein